MKERTLKHHRESAYAALTAGPYEDLRAAADAIATAVVESDGEVRWVVIVDTTPPIAYGPYASAATARKAIDSGLMLGKRAMLLAMKPVPRAGHRNTEKEK